MLDINKDGEISYEELHSAYRKIYGPEADLIVEKIFTNLDLDNSGKITFSEFITFATEITANFSQEQLREAFKLFDSDNDGLIDKR
jgi:calcium-dependent protein kinase